MRPKKRNQRLKVFVVAGLFALIGAFLLLKALQDNKQFFKNPSDVVNALYVQGEQDIRVGGLVVTGSIEKGDGLLTSFSVIDFEDADPNIPVLSVKYNKVLPDLFREGQGVVVTGKLGPGGEFVASEVLAKHDENYMPKMPEKTVYSENPAR